MEHDNQKSTLWLYHIVCFVGYSMLSVLMGIFCPVFLDDIFPLLQILIAVQVFLLFFLVHFIILHVQHRNQVAWRMLMLKRLYDHSQTHLSTLQGRLMIMSEQVADVGQSSGQQHDFILPKDKLVLQEPLPMGLGGGQKFLSPDDLLKQGEAEKKTSKKNKPSKLTSFLQKKSKETPDSSISSVGEEELSIVPQDFIQAWNMDEEKIKQACHINLWHERDGDVSWYVQQALDENLMHIYIQPVVVLPQRRRRFFECFHWIKTEEGKIILPRYYEKSAHELGILTQMNQDVLQKCLLLLQQLHRYDPMLAFICNIHPLSFKDHSFWQGFIKSFAQESKLAGKLVLEISQELFLQYKETLIPILRQAGKVGILFSLDHVTHFDESLLELGEYSFCFLKIDSEVLLKKTSTDEGYHAFISLRDALLSRGVYIVASKVENESEMVEVLDYGIQYAQGFLLGEPRLSKLQPLADHEDA